MLKVGIVGFGFMGRMHYRCWAARGDVQVVAICDVNPNIVEDSKKAVGNVDGAAEEIDFSGIKIFTRPDQMFRQCDLDAVSITLPTFLHPEVFIQAVQAGLHVLCEKPMALTVGDCDRMIEAAQGSKKAILIGQCERFSPAYLKVKEYLDSGEYGRVRVAAFRRVGAMPTWAWDNWFVDTSRSGGVELDLHIHDSDLVQYLFGMPKAVTSFSYNMPGGGIGHIHTRYRFDDKLITAEGGWLMTQSFGFEMSAMLVLEKATLIFDCARKPSFKVYPADGDAFAPELIPGDDYTVQVDHFARRAQGQQVPEVATLEQARNSILIVENERESARSGREIIIGK